MCVHPLQLKKKKEILHPTGIEDILSKKIDRRSRAPVRV